MQRDIRSPGSVVYGCVYNPSPSAKTVLLDGKSVTNKDSKINDQYAAPTGTCLRKGAQDEWRTGKNVSENPTIIIRYADVLLMYAEAKIELGELDASMLNAINDVRARAYKTTRDNTAAYPALALSDQNTMRLAVRKERRVGCLGGTTLLRPPALGRMDGEGFQPRLLCLPDKTGYGRYGKSRRLLLALNSGD